MNTIHVALADDQVLFRKGLASLLQSFDGIRVDFEAGDGATLMELLAHVQALPDVVILDLNMPGMNGLDATTRIHARFPGIKIIVLTVLNDSAMVVRMLKQGAHAYLLKEAEPADVEKAIRSVHANGFYFDAQTITAISQEQGRHPKPVQAFSPEEARLFSLLLSGKDMQQASAQLNIPVAETEKMLSKHAHSSLNLPATLADAVRAGIRPD